MNPAPPMPRPSRPAAGLLGVLVVGSVGDALSFVVSTLRAIAANGPVAYVQSLDPATFPWRPFLVHLAAVALTLALTALALWHAARSPDFEDSSRALWLVALVVAAPLPLPLYWYLHVWRRPRAARPAP